MTESADQKGLMSGFFYTGQKERLGLFIVKMVRLRPFLKVLGSSSWYAYNFLLLVPFTY